MQVCSHVAMKYIIVVTQENKCVRLGLHEILSIEIESDSNRYMFAHYACNDVEISR